MRIKTRITLIVALLAAAAAALFITFMNVTIGGYIDREARSSMQSVFASLSETEYTETDHSKPQIIFDVIWLQVDEQLNLVSTYEGETSLTYTKNDRAVLDHVRGQKVDFSREHMTYASVLGQRYLIGTTSGPVWDEGSTGSSDAASESATEPQVESPTSGTGKWILYINMGPASDILRLLNIMLGAALVVMVGLATAVGYRAGLMVENSERRLKTFFANASHELKTPLMSIQGYAEGISTGVVKDPKAGATVILQQGDKMETLVEELLLISKIDSGDFRFDKTAVDVNDLVDACTSSAKAFAQTREVEVEVLYSKDLPVILGDANQLQRAIGNVVENAARFAKSRVLVEVAAKNSAVEVRVSDDGPGVTQEDAPKIFDRFYKGAGGNTGLGLSVAAQIVAAHKAKLELTKEAGSSQLKGATFVFTFPLPRATK
ncbi:MAG: HAMP domain-containing sensor histidine kinase [Actinomycetaceae bacterium]|nr:HAMP domain-containing sensor histidine kinase [Actinomycetaceae bacterium]